MRKFLLTVLLLVVPFVVSAQYQNYEGNIFQGTENLSLELVNAESPWSTVDLVGDLILEACVSSDGAIAIFEREELVVTSTGAIVPVSGVNVYTWSPTAHGYVYESDIVNQGRRRASVLVFRQYTIELHDVEINYNLGDPFVYDGIGWDWLHVIPARIEVKEETLR